MLLVLLLGLFQPPAQATGTTCFQQDNSVVLEIVVPRDVRLFVADDGQIKWADVMASKAFDCGDATVRNVDSVEASANSPDDTRLILDVARKFAPGDTAEAMGKSEIEFAITGDTNENTLQIRGGRKSDRFVAGAAGIALNDDGDVDISSPTADEYVFLGKGGIDYLSGNGGNGTGNAFDTALTIYGNGGGDRLLGTNARDQLLGSAGGDFVDGGGRGDIVFGNGGEDVLLGRSGADELDGHGGPDRLRGHGGADNLEGGPGTDDCKGGPGTDVVSTCETGGG
ncbi:MAG: hypothetical protein M3174_02145 [Actinomycetota bacterium]|nr:hypothetical protein [Actinomycetota bacterium]